MKSPGPGFSRSATGKKPRPEIAMSVSLVPAWRTPEREISARALPLTPHEAYPLVVPPPTMVATPPSDLLYPTVWALVLFSERAATRALWAGRKHVQDGIRDTVR